MSHVISGVLLLALGIWGIIAWWASFGLVVRGLVPFGLLAVGLVAVLSGYHRMTVGDDDEEEEEE